MPRRRRRIAIHYPRDATTDERVRLAARRADERHGIHRASEQWRPWAYANAEFGGPRPDRPGPTLALDDYSRIPFVRSVVGVEWYQYRARLRAGSGDAYAVAADPIPGYESYNRTRLGLGDAHLIRLERAPSGDLSLAERLLEDASAFRALEVLVRGSTALVIHPYMAVDAVWHLARALGNATGEAVRVLGPPPLLTRLVNDKAAFSAIVRDLLGAEALARTTTSSDPAVLAETLRDEAERSPAVALKMPSCASGMGNRIFAAGALRGRPLSDHRDLVDRFLREKEWDGREPVLVVEWHRDVLESPSTQCWIPPLGSGEPVVEEVFQQLLTGEEQVFQGAVLSGLPRPLRHRFMIRSWLLCRVFQHLGYVGRCSFDALVVGDDIGTASVRFVECNGRWGGTSTPMHLMQRVFGDFRSVPYRGQGYSDPRLRGLTFIQLLELFGSHLYDRRTGRGRVLLYNVGGLQEHGKFDMVVTGRTYAEVDRFVADTIPRLIDSYVGAVVEQSDRRPR